MASKPLDGIRVVELGQLLAGPFAGTQLAYFGAEVIKVEPPVTGDPIRSWREVKDGTSLWWHSLGRNKKCITANLRTDQGRALVKQLLLKADVVIENFRPGTLEKWGLAPDDLKPLNPDLIYARISGYGQTGPYSSRPGYASVTEGFGGFRYVNGVPGDAPVRPNLSMGDTLGGIHAVMGILLALLQRGKAGSGVTGQTVDVALYESVFNLLEGVVPEYDGADVVRQPSGSTITGIVPTNTYPCNDGKYVIIGGNGDSIFKRLMIAAGRADMAADERLKDNIGRVKHEAEIDVALTKWTATLSAEQVLHILAEESVPAGPIYSVADMMQDPHYQARGLFEQVEVSGQPLKIPALMPKLDKTPGGTTWPGPEVGSHNAEILGDLLGLDEQTRKDLAEKGVI